MLIANADRLTEIECHSPNLINTDLSECTKLQRIDLSDCTALGTGIGAQPILNIQNCKYLRYVNCMNTQLTAIYTMQAGGNLEEIYYPQSTQVVQLTNQTYLHTVGIPYIYGDLLKGRKLIKSVSGIQLDSNNNLIEDTEAYYQGGCNSYLPVIYGTPYSYTKAEEMYVFEFDGDFNKINYLTINPDSTYTPSSEKVKFIKVVFRYPSYDERYPTKLLANNIDGIQIVCENLANVQISNCNAIERLQYPYSLGDPINFDAFKYVQNLNITNSLSGLNSMQFNGFDKLRNVTLSSLKELDTIGFEDMMPVTTTSTLKNITISDCPLITSLSFNVSSDDYKVAFASNGKLDLGGLQSLKSIECNTSVKGLDTLIVPTSLTDLRFTTEYGDGINEIKNIWSANAVHNNDGFEGIDFQDMTIEFIDMLGLNGISNAINFHIAPKTQNPNLNTARDGSASKPWFHPIGSIDLSNYTGLMIGMLRGIDLNKLDVVINTDRDQVDLTSLFECATLPTSQNIVTKTNNILVKFPKSVIWDYMFKGCDLSFSPKDIRIPNRGLSLKGMYKDSNVTEDVSLPNVIMAVDEMFMNCTGITTYEKNWLKTYSKITYTVPTSNGTSGSWDDNGNYTESTSYNQFLYTPSDGEKAFKIMTTGTGVVRINYFYNASFISRIVYTPEFDSYPYVVTIPDNCNKIIFVCDTVVRFVSEGNITTKDCYTNTGGDLAEIPVAWGGYGFTKATTSILELVIPENNYTLTLNPDMILATIDKGEHSGYDIYNRISWGDGTVTKGEHSHTYTTAGTYTFKGHYYMGAYEPTATLKVCLSKIHQIPRYYKSSFYNHRFLAKDCKNLTEVTINNFVTTPNNNGLLQAFNGCTNLKKVTLTADMPIPNVNSMFYNCSSLTEIVGMETWDMSKCTSYGDFLNGCSSITYDTLLQLSNVLDFSSCRDVSGVGSMFEGVTFDNAVPIQQLNVSAKTNFDGMLSGVKVNGDLDLSMWNVHPTNLENFLNNATINGAVNFSGWDVSNCTNFKRMLYWSNNITSVNLSGWDFSNGTSDSYAFMGCPASDWNFTGASGIKFDINIQNSVSQNWSVDSLVGLFNALYDFASAGDTGTHTITLGSTNLAKLSDEQIAIATNKGWTINA